MPVRYRLARNVTRTPAPDGGSVLTDVAHDRLYSLNPTATALLDEIVAEQEGAKPGMLGHLTGLAYEWAEDLTATLLRRHLLEEVDS